MLDLAALAEAKLFKGEALKGGECFGKVGCRYQESFKWCECGLRNYRLCGMSGIPKGLLDLPVSRIRATVTDELTWKGWSIYGGIDISALGYRAR